MWASCGFLLLCTLRTKWQQNNVSQRVSCCTSDPREKVFCCMDPKGSFNFCSVLNNSVIIMLEAMGGLSSKCHSRSRTPKSFLFQVLIFNHLLLQITADQCQIGIFLNKHLCGEIQVVITQIWFDNCSGTSFLNLSQTFLKASRKNSAASGNHNLVSTWMFILREGLVINSPNPESLGHIWSGTSYLLREWICWGSNTPQWQNAARQLTVGHGGYSSSSLSSVLFCFFTADTCSNRWG